MKVAVYMRVATKEQLENSISKVKLQKIFVEFSKVPVWDMYRRYNYLIRR